MVVAQKVKEAEITEQDSLLLTRNLLRIAIFNISYIRGLFPEKYFNDKSVPALDIKIKKLMPMDAESRRLIDWMEKGVYDALQKKYLKTLLFCVCEAAEGPMIEEYAFSFSYSGCDSQEVMMNINRSGSKRQGGTFKCNSTEEITPNQMRSSACKMVRTLVQLMRTLDKMPEQRTILMKLLYYDDLTPEDYEPPFFRGSTEEEAHNPWTKSPLKMEVGNVNSKHFVLALKVKSVLDPCEDENEDIQDDGVSLGDDSVQRDSSDSDSDSESDKSQEDQFIVAPAEKPQQQDTPMAEEDDTQEPMEVEHQLARVKDWINNRHLDTVELTDILSNFPDISVVLTEEIMEKLVKEGVLSKTGGDTYVINRQKKFDYEFNLVKEEIDGQVGDKAAQIDDLMYMKCDSVEITVNINHNGNKRQGKKTAMEDLPDELFTVIFARTPIRFHRSIGEVSMRWRRIVCHRRIYDIRFQLGITDQVLCLRHRYGFRDLSEWYKCDLMTPRRAVLTPLPNIQVVNLEMSATVAVGSCIYVIGGMFLNATDNYERTNNVWIFDVFRSVQWDLAPAMPRLLGAPKAVVLGHRIFVVGSFRGFYAGLEYDTITMEWNTFRIPGIRRSEPMRNFVAVDGQLFLLVGPYGFVCDRMQEWTRYDDIYFNEEEGNVANTRGRWYRQNRFQEISVLEGRPLTWRPKGHVYLVDRTNSKIVAVGHQLFMLLERKHDGKTEAWLVEIGTRGRRRGTVLRRHGLLREDTPPGDDFTWAGYFEDCNIVGVQG